MTALPADHSTSIAHDAFVEQVVLGALLTNPDAWLKVSEVLTAPMFGKPEHAHIYQAGHHLFTQNKPVDLVTMCDALRLAGTLDQIGGPVYLVECTSHVASSANLEHHARIIVQHFLARQLDGMLHEAAIDQSANPDPFDRLDRISTRVTDLYSLAQPTVMGNAGDQVRELLDRKPSVFHTFGIPELDRLAVLEAGLPVVIAGRPGIGKSILCLEVCWHLTLAGSVLLFSPEMTEKQVTARLLARESGVPYSTILKGRMVEAEMDAVTAASMRIGDRLTRLKVDPQSGITPDQIRIRTERAMKTHGVIAFAVDHLHKMRTGNHKVDREDFARISQCMDGITDVAKSTNLPALVMCQLNREVEKRSDRRPNIADLRGSGKIEENAAVIGLLYRDGYYKSEPPYEDILEIAVAKNRDGGTGMATAPVTPALNRIGYSLQPREVKQQLDNPF